MFIVKHRKIFYTFSLMLVAASIVAFCVWGMSFSIDFTGGSSVQIPICKRQTGYRHS